VTEPSEMTDDEFVAFVAAIKSSDEIPRELHGDLRPIFDRCIRLGVIDEPAPETLVTDLIAHCAERAAARP
jgi:hypothetical protein